MGELFLSISTILSYLTTMAFWAGLVLIIAMLRKLTKDVADLKKTIAALEETALLMPRPEQPSRADGD
ncbi:MAG TPA: hypothetical protein VHA11_04200 [Bryobacteraceae bacterium]|nr:hypothetical protein [Bryobacteraceae bacterium]